MDRTVVIGAGLMGLTSAWFLAQRGHRVTVLERCAGPASEASFANGGLLTPSMSDPWNAPGVHWNLLKWIGRGDAPMLLRFKAIPSLMSWGIGFLRNSAPARFRRNMLANYVLAAHSLDTMRSFLDEQQQELIGTGRGTMKVFRDARSLEHAVAVTDTLAQHGLRCELLDAAGVVRAEPHLSMIADRIVGGLLYPDDRSGDAHQFCCTLAEILRERGVEIMYGADVHGIVADTDGIAGVRYRTERQPGHKHRESTIRTSRLVIAAGSGSPGLVFGLNIRLPVKPVKGYSLTTDAVTELPRLPVVDDSLHAAVTPLGERLRVVGTAEFSGFDLSLPRARIDNLIHLFASIYPHLQRQTAREDFAVWAGLRPVSPDGVPIIGPTPIRGLYLNTGHGHLGWTLAMGSARLLADIMTPSSERGADAGIDVSRYELARFCRS